MVEIAANAAKTMTTIDCASLAQPAKAAENPAIMAISATFDATLAQAKAATAEVSEGAIAPGKTLPPIAARQPLAAFIAKGGSLQRHDAAAPEQTEATHGDAALQDTVQAPAELPLAGEAAARLASLIVAQPISQPAPAQSAAPRPAPATTTAGQTSAPVAIPARSVPAPRQAAPQREPGLAFIHVPGGLLLEIPADSPPPRSSVRSAPAAPAPAITAAAATTAAAAVAPLPRLQDAAAPSPAQAAPAASTAHAATVAPPAAQDASGQNAATGNGETPARQAAPGDAVAKAAAAKDHPAAMQEPAPAPAPALAVQTPTAGEPGVRVADAASRPAQRIDVTTLVDTIARARSDHAAATPAPVAVALTHAEFGKVSLRFHTDDEGLAVTMASADPAFAPAVVRASDAASAQGQPSFAPVPQQSSGTAAAQDTSRGGPPQSGTDVSQGHGQGQSQAANGGDARQNASSRQDPSRTGSPLPSRNDARGNADKPARHDGIFA